MEDNTSRSNASAQSMETPLVRQNATPEPKGESLEAKVHEQRQAYGTAKTENLRDNGLWRILIPAVIVIFGVALIAIPLIILIPLLAGSLDPNAAQNSVAHAHLIWVWIAMTLMEMGLVALIIWGIFRIFLTQAGNYRR